MFKLTFSRFDLLFHDHAYPKVFPRRINIFGSGPRRISTSCSVSKRSGLNNTRSDRIKSMAT
jgi:hypothetical protein